MVANEQPLSRNLMTDETAFRDEIRTVTLLKSTDLRISVFHGDKDDDHVLLDCDAVCNCG
jgi:hypothetical protein